VSTPGQLPPALARRIDVDAGGCWLWRGRVNLGGYGRLRFLGSWQLVHRIVWWLLVKPPIEGMHLDHLCRVRKCVNPDHLREVTPRENAHAPGSLSPAKLNSEKSCCPEGHPYEGENLILTAKGYRACRICTREGARIGARRRRQQLRLAAGVEVVTNSLKRTCPRGHLYDGANLIVRSNGWRRCRICAREVNRPACRRYRARLKVRSAA